MPTDTEIRKMGDNTRPYPLDNVSGLEKLECFYTFMADEEMGRPHESGYQPMSINDFSNPAISSFIKRLLKLEGVTSVAIGPNGFRVTASHYVWHLIEARIFFERDVLYEECRLMRTR